MGQGARIRNQDVLLHGKTTALVCVQPADLHLKEIMQLDETAGLFLFPKITTLADGLWQCGLHST